VKASGLSRVRQVFLLCALAIGIVGMHHLTAGHDMAGAPSPTVVVMMSVSPDMSSAVQTFPSPAAAQNPNAPMPSHDVMHLCLAVLWAIGIAIAVLWLLLWVSRGALRSGVPSGLRQTRAPDRPPDRRGRTLLTSFCILRV
jgi:beta-lactamase regulating signal transducer with metallopeptidase domain